MIDVPISASSGGGDASEPILDRAGLAERADVPQFVVDLVIDAGLLTPLDNGHGGECFGPGDIEMLAAARALVGEGVAIEEMAALAMRHATNVENLIDDAIDLLKRSVDRAALAAAVERLVPMATQLVVGHFERTLRTRAMARIGGADTAAGTVVAATRRLAGRVDPLAVYASAGAARQRSLWLRPDAQMGLVAIGAVETIEPAGEDRFTRASAARTVLAARVKRDAPDGAPAPVLVGGFSFVPSDGVSTGGEAPSGDPPSRGPAWEGFGDCRLVLPELTVIARPDGTWVQAATRVGSDGDEDAARAALEARLSEFEQQTPTAAATLMTDGAREPAARTGPGGATGHRRPDTDTDDDYIALVASAIAAIERGEFHKVVLARTVTLDVEVDTVAVLDLLRRRNPTCAVFAFNVDDSTFLGATPEELVTLDGARLHTTALAGTAPRGDSSDTDGRLAAGLLASAKNRSEHRFVVEGITGALTGLGLVDPAPKEPDVLTLSRVQHLRTPISATVQRRRTGASDMDVVRAAGVLHPTAATGGAPTGSALGFIADHESFTRGWYAAPVGWCDLEGNGEMGVALRSALVEGGRVHLFAGNGIVADSDPADELQETSLKLRAVLDAIDGANDP